MRESLKNHNPSIGTWPGNNNSSSRVQILIVNTARRVSSPLLTGRRTFLIADECHRYATPKNIQALDFDPACTLGLTATAERQYDDGLYDLLIPKIGPIFFNYDLAAARLDNVVSPFNIVNVEIPLRDGEQLAYSSLTRKIARAAADENEDLVKSLSLRRATIVKSAWMRIPAAIALLEQLRGRRTLVFHEDIVSAEVVARLLEERNHSVATYHSQMGDSLRRDNLRNFQEGIVEILVTCRALDEGVDVPDADCAMIIAGTASTRQRVQRLGRVLRNSPGKTDATIYTIYATESEREKLHTEQVKLDDVADVRWITTSASRNA